MIVSHLLLILHKKIQFYIFMFEALNVAKVRKVQGGRILSQGTVNTIKGYITTYNNEHLVKQLWKPICQFLRLLSLPDLFHLSLWLSPPPPGVIYFPQCIYPCVSCLSVPVCLVCSSQPVCFSHAPAFSFLFLLVLPVWTLTCFWTLYPPAWPFSLPWPRACLPFCTSGPELVLTFCLSITILLPTPFGLLINILDSNHLPPVSASCALI